MPLRTRVARLAASADFGDHRFDRDHEPLHGGGRCQDLLPEGASTTGVTPRAANEVVTIPLNLAVPNSYLVFSEVSYQYVPVTGFSPGFSHISAFGITVSDVMCMGPRITPPK